jgi:hypothetical protein
MVVEQAVALVTEGFPFDDEPTVNSQDELAVATSGVTQSQAPFKRVKALRDVGVGLPTAPGQVALPSVLQRECGTRGRQAVPLRRKASGKLRGHVAQGPLSGPAALPAARLLSRGHEICYDIGPIRTIGASAEKPQGWRASLALQFT